MSSLRRLCIRFAFVGTALVSIAGMANAQSASSSLQSAAPSSTESSSMAYLSMLGNGDGAGFGALPSAPAPASSAAAGQYDNRSGGSHQGLFKHYAFELGAGFNGPIGNDSPYITWGGNFTGGFGFHFTHGLSALAEYQFMDNKLPGAFVAAGGGTGGNAHIQSITVDPVLDLFPKSGNSVYVVGGGGWYHKSTNFTIQECCDFYGYPVTVNANSFSSNQLGGNIGLGITHRLGGVYGDGTTKLFAEARYLFINTPSINSTNGLGSTELIPVTFGVRF